MTAERLSDPIIISIDQGTTSTRCVAFQLDGNTVATDKTFLRQIYPSHGRVEQNPEDIWNTVHSTLKSVVTKIGGPERVSAIGITNQRETTVLWDRYTGEAVHNAISWQDRRGAQICRDLAKSHYGEVIRQRTGLIPDSYFSATKIQWILENDRNLRERANRGDLAFGTIDTFLLWRLTNGAVHATDATNASRTMIYDIHRQCWDEELADIFGIPLNVLPIVCDTAHPYGTTDADLFGARIPITALVGDQQSALAGQFCFLPGMAKCTFGTGAFVLLNTGATPSVSENKLITTVASQLDQKITFALEGSVFNAGTIIQWLRDEAGFIDTAGDSAKLAASAVTSEVTFVPAFTGLGAPHWNPDARGAILGLTRNSSSADIVRAGLEAVCFQTHELLSCMAADTCQTLDILRVDGGMAENDWMLQFLADITGVPVERPTYLETTSQGAALLAGLAVGLYESLSSAAETRCVDKVFEPQQSVDWRESNVARWHDAVKRINIA